ncbi:MAG: nicotinate (nicotinamide) nucleotide adenylyltransferase [Desulfobacterales bacterium]|nr:nicotinate (nicotinamide) nucleotide adenylyltransferase [Desulfobacterales bacterium]
MRIGLFGGTFNPIHLGHLRAVQEVQEAFNMDKCYLIPAAIPPHKKQIGIASAEDRFEMVKLATSDSPNFIVSDVELKRSGPSYTIDTVIYYQSILPKATQLYLIVGIDSFLQIEIWKFYPDLFSHIAFIVMARPGPRGKQIFSNRQVLENFMKSRISADYRFSIAQNCFMHPEKQAVYICDVSLLDISSTKIRRLIKDGRSIKFLVPEKVEEFIKTKGLYL